MTISFDKMFDFGNTLADRLGAKAFVTVATEAVAAMSLYLIVDKAENIQELVAAQLIIISGFAAMTVVAAIFMFARHKEKTNGNSNKQGDKLSLGGEN